MSEGVLPALAALLLVLARFVPPHGWVLIDLAATVFPSSWEVSGVLFDANDLILAALAASFLFHRSEPSRSQTGWPPYLRIWLLYGFLRSISYLYVPLHGEQLTDPIRATYQLYRYPWRPILFYVFAYRFLSTPDRILRTLAILVLSVDYCATVAVWQGYHGVAASGTLSDKNQFGGFLIIPLTIFISCGLFDPRKLLRMTCALSSLLLFRALLFSQSRGALMGLLVALAFFSGTLLARRSTRAAVWRLGATAATIAFVVLAFRPGVLERDYMRRMATVSSPLEVETLQWRMHERWPHYWQRIKANPWLGVGDDRDPELSRAKTSHNGYLSMAIIHGLPALATYLALLFLGIRNGLLVYRRRADPFTSVFGLALASGLFGVMIHNIVEASMNVAWTEKLIWLCAAWTGALAGGPSRVSGKQSSPLVTRGIGMTTRPAAPR